MRLVHGEAETGRSRTRVAPSVQVFIGAEEDLQRASRGRAAVPGVGDARPDHRSLREGRGDLRPLPSGRDPDRRAAMAALRLDDGVPAEPRPPPPPTHGPPPPRPPAPPPTP